MRSAVGRKSDSRGAHHGFGSEADVEAITGISRRTLQKDRLLGRKRFPWYKSGRRVLYDLNEVEAIIRGTIRGGPSEAEFRPMMLVRGVLPAAGRPTMSGSPAAGR